MSDMDRHSRADPGHPEEQLASYVDGSATDLERRTVDLHLASCERCRTEVDLARRSRAALASLPELPALGLGAGGLETFLTETGAATPNGDVLSTQRTSSRQKVGRRATRPRRLRWDRLALGAGLAAAAGLFVFFAATGLFKHSTTAPVSGAAASRQPAPVIQRGATYTPASMQALANQLRPAASKNETVSRPVPGAALGADRSPTFGSNRTSVVTCLQSAAGVPTSIQPIYLEAATFQSTPAYIGAFVLPPAAGGSRSHLLVVAASENGCQPLYVVRETA